MIDPQVSRSSSPATLDAPAADAGRVPSDTSMALCGLIVGLVA